MSDKSDRPRLSRGALYLVITAGLGIIIGMYFVATGVAAIAAGRWFDRSGGGVGSIVTGALMLGAGTWVARLGREVIVGEKRDASSGK